MWGRMAAEVQLREWNAENRGFYMSAHVFLNLLNELGEKERCDAFPKEFNTFSNTGARMQDSISHMTLKSHFFSKFCTKTSQFRH